jgi:hypothetical protein
MQTTIILHLEEHIDTDYVNALAPMRGTMTPARVQLAKAFGFDEHLTPKDLHKRADLVELAERIHRIAERNDAVSEQVSKTTWKIVQRTTKPRASFEFPADTFTGDSTKWGSTDFYAPVQEQMVAAIRSGLDFETPWMSCKKEILSSKVSRTRGTVTVEVNVWDDFDTQGTGTASGRMTKNLSRDAILRRLSKLGCEAQDEADRDRKSNQDYAGYTIRNTQDPSVYALTYIANVCGDDTPSGDYYSHCGWQDVEYDENDNPAEFPSEDRIPRDVAMHLAKEMNELKGEIEYKGFIATPWR